MTLEEMLRGSPLNQQRMADDNAMNLAGMLARGRAGTVQQEPNMVERGLSNVKRSFYGDKNLYGNDPINPSVLDSQYVSPEMAEGAVLDLVGGPMTVSGRVAKEMFANNPYLKGVAEGDELIGMHNLSADNLAHAQEMGGLPVPSIGISKANAPLEGFGDISLIAKQDMVTPGRGNPVFGADAYSRRYPEIVEHRGDDKIFKGFTAGGNRKYAQHTLDNLVNEMKGVVPNSEGFNYGAGSLRSELTPKFKNLKGVQKSRNKVVPEKEMPAIKDEMNERLYGLVDDLLPYDKRNKKYELGYGDTVTSRLGPKERLSDYYDNIPPELQDKISTFKSELVDSPTAYFEAKPQRAVRLDEFGGAVVPDNIDARTLEILKRNGIENVERYGGTETGKYKTKADAMKKFRDLMFSIGGSGFLASQLLGQERE
jgi:hypothetical protein